MFEVDPDSELREFEGDYDDYLHALGELSHKPIIPPREGFPGENVYAFEWETLNATVGRPDLDPPNALLANILYDMQRRITQRHASVAASFITWLGTNAGMCFKLTAQRIREESRGLLTLEDAYGCAWAIENRRRSHVNSGSRAIEHILAGVDDFGKDLFGGMYGLRRAPDLHVEDYETIEHLVAWLASPRAVEFVARCEYLIDLRGRYPSAMQTVRVIAGVSA